VLSFIESEPAMVIGVLDAVIMLLISFGVPISGDQKVQIDGVLAAVGALVAAYATRQLVTPTSKVQALVNKALVTPTPLVPKPEVVK